MGQAFSDCLFHPERLDQYSHQLRTCVRDQVSRECLRKWLPLSGRCVSEEGRLLQPQKSERQLFGHHVLPLAGKLVLIIKQRCTVFHQV